MSSATRRVPFVEGNEANRALARTLEEAPRSQRPENSSRAMITR